MSDPYTYYYNWAQNVNYKTQEYLRRAKPIERNSYSCEKCNKEYNDVLTTGHLCYYCHKTYGSCCKGRYGVCTHCWQPLSASERSAQKKRYRKIVIKTILPAGIVLPFIFFGVVGGLLLANFGTAVGLPVLLVGEFGSVAILAIVLIRKTTNIEAQRAKRKKLKTKLTKNQKIAIYALVVFLLFIIIAPIIVLLSVLN